MKFIFQEKYYFLPYFTVEPCMTRKLLNENRSQNEDFLPQKYGVDQKSTPDLELRSHQC